MNYKKKHLFILTTYLKIKKKALSKLVTKQSNNESLVTSLEFGERISALADQFQISSYHLTMIYASLFKLHRSALRMSSLKQEVLY